ncbi:MAG: hypothetical protein KGH72_05535 [Candidatus Micrarchaeota archaeon]|nr:hypothetical protein [Candidatus Micrarchaeota archaeon]
MMTNDLSATSSAQNLQVSYSLNLSGVGSILGNNISISEYKLGNDSKLITSFDLLGEQATTAVFDENNTDVACTESAYTQLTCSLANKTTANTNLFHLAKTFNLSQVNVTYLGQGSVVGRPCDIFYVNGSQAAISQFYGNTSLSSSNSSAGSNATYRIGMCIDKQTGIPLKLNVSEISYSQLLGRNQKGQVVTIIATNMSVGTVTHKELNIPSTVILDKSSAGGLFNYIDCNSTALYFNVTPTSKMSRLNITLNESVYDFNTSSYENTTIIKTSRTGNYNPFVNYSIVLPDNNTPNGRIDICINGECNTGFYCYFNSTGGYNTTVNTTQ